MDYIDASIYIERFINNEKKHHLSGSDMSLERVLDLFERLNAYCRDIKVVHVAGTKGKGSTAHMMADVLALSGYRVGLFTSPHLFDIKERISIKSMAAGDRQVVDTANITEEEFAAVITAVNEVIRDDYGCATYFEILTAAAFMFFKRQDPDFIVVETGLGGRLDATNVVDPILSIITSIGLEHTSVLGDTLEKIAREKFGIIKNGRPVICAGIPANIQSILSEYRDSDVYLEDRNFHVENVFQKENGLYFEFCSCLGNLRDMKCGLYGAVQAHNAALVCMAFMLLKFKGIALDGNALYGGIGNAGVSGRFTVVEKDGRKFILDVAHTKESIKQLRETIMILYPDCHLEVVFGCGVDKDAAAMLEVFKDDKVFAVKASHPRASDLTGFGTCMDIPSALNMVTSSLVLITGSVFVVAEAMRILDIS